MKELWLAIGRTVADLLGSKLAKDFGVRIF